MNQDKTLQEFISNVGASKVAIIIPLYGYWKDSEYEALDSEVLEVVLKRVRTLKHQMYVFFVAERDRLSPDVQNAIAVKHIAGYAKGVEAEPGSTYASYVMEGMQYALENTDAEYLIILNPWIAIKENGIDAIVERANRGDVAIVSGYEVNEELGENNFDEYQIELPKEFRDVNMNFVCVKRPYAEMITMDSRYLTHYFIGADFWQNMFAKGFEVISSQFIPTYSFGVDWTMLESREEFESDKRHFIEKWRFAPNVNYEQR